MKILDILEMIPIIGLLFIQIHMIHDFNKYGVRNVLLGDDSI